MKILHITPYYPPHLGGMEQRVRDLSELLAKKGYDVEIFTSNIGCKKEKLKSTNNLKINYLKSLEFAHTPIIPSLFWRLMRIPKGSIMHVHIAQALVPEIVWLVSKLRGIDYISHIRLDISSSGKLGFLLPVYKKLFLKKVLRDASKIIVLTEDYRYIISEKYNISQKKIKVIPNGNSFIISKISKKFNKKFIKILFVGRLSKQKNIPLLFDSFNLFNKKVKNSKLYIVGDGEEKDNLLRIIKSLRLEKKIIMTGEIKKEKIQKIYRSCDLFILTSREESFGTVLIEAMATELPIITLNIPAVRNIIKDGYNGLLVEPTPEKIAEAIEKLIKNPKLREKLAKNGLKEVKKYSWDKIVEQTEEVYKEVLNQKNAPPKN